MWCDRCDWNAKFDLWLKCTLVFIPHLGFHNSLHFCQNLIHTKKKKKRSKTWHIFTLYQEIKTIICERWLLYILLWPFWMSEMITFYCFGLLNLISLRKAKAIVLNCDALLGYTFTVSSAASQRFLNLTHLFLLLRWPIVYIKALRLQG